MFYYLIYKFLFFNLLVHPFIHKRRHVFIYFVTYLLVTIKHNLQRQIS